MPQMQLSTLVLPAPFGPMSASSSPLSSANETPSSTLRPPKARCSSRSSSSAIPAAAPAVSLHLAVAAPHAAAAVIYLRDVGVRTQPLGSAVEHHVAVLHPVAVVRALQRHAGILLDEEERHAKLAAYRLQPLHQLLDQQRGEALRELVH